ncbi:AMP-binding protein [Nocardia brasiliensis]|uniref:AMP-binding protein n=1 Tax=Nocardia brasiliensis TaxID=37326 RepID=UPI002457050B|nr:AMP-binding protein [Nocardia brasiliensis]
MERVHLPFSRGARTLPTQLRQVAVLQRAGVIDLRRPDQIIRTSRSVRTLGPIAGTVEIAALRFPDRIALIDESGLLTYRELAYSTNALAQAWLTQGVSARTPIGVLCRDHRGMVQALIAGAKIGARVVLLNTGFGATQLSDVVAREGVGAVLADDEFDSATAALGPEIRRLDLRATKNSVVARPPAPATQGGFVILTGGTTGTPKGVPRKVETPLAAAQFLDRVPYRSGGVTLLCAPLFHGTALTQFIMSLSLGCTVVLHGRFDARRAVAQIQEYRCTAVVLVPTMLRRILDLGAAEIRGYDTSSLRIVFSAGAALPSALGSRAIELFGPVLYNFYGCTETGTATIATPRDWIAAPGTVGKPPVGIVVRLYDNGRPVTGPGAKGTVYVGNSIAFTGYSGGGGKNIVDGLMSTGDVGHFDAAGRLFIDGRDDDMIVSGGENVFPGEVEDLLYRHPKITEAAVIGVPDEEFGQRLAAFLIAHGDLSGDEVRAYVRDHLARFKVPRDVRFVEDLPRTPTGKINRGALAALALT